MFAKLLLIYFLVLRMLFLMHTPHLISSIENDICVLKKSVDYLGSTLSQCVMNHTRLKFMFRKKHAPLLHAHHSQHTHVHHAHTHDSMYVRVYTCTHCGGKGNLAKFYYDRLNDLNFASKFVWVRKEANLMDPTKIHPYYI